MPDREYGFSNEVARTFTNLAAISAVVDPEIRTMRWTITVQYDLPPIVYFLSGNYPSLVSDNNKPTFHCQFAHADTRPHRESIRTN